MESQGLFSNINDVIDRNTYIQDKDYIIERKINNPEVVLLAIHGGNLEPGTSEIVKYIAADKYTYYSFEFLRKEIIHNKLHVPSTQFDEISCLEVVGPAKKVISFHGFLSNDEEIILGGLDDEMKAKLGQKLKNHQYSTRKNPKLRGISKENICNRNYRKKGLQIELSLGLREKMFHGGGEFDRSTPTDKFYEFCDLVRLFIEESYDCRDHQ